MRTQKRVTERRVASKRAVRGRKDQVEGGREEGREEEKEGEGSKEGDYISFQNHRA